jgi:hypothetical protein
MKLHGRITFFGEHLIKQNLTHCLCVKSKLYLSDEYQFKTIGNQTYIKQYDETIPVLKQHGIDKFSTIYGNLPLGFGLSSSTILSILHLKSSARHDLIKIVDEKMHGFSPSDLDYTSIVKQENGFYGFGKWIPIIGFTPIYSLVLVPKEENSTLVEVKIKIKDSIPTQIKLVESLMEKLKTTGALDLDLFLEHCKTLLSCRIYSDSATQIISDLIGKNIPSKCIGGLYDRAILILHNNVQDKYSCEETIVQNYSFAKIIE